MVEVAVLLLLVMLSILLALDHLRVMVEQGFKLI